MEAGAIGGAPTKRSAKSGGGFDGSFAECKEQQLVFLLVRPLAAAQIELAHAPMTARLWQEVAALEIDPERITALLYGGQDVTDRAALVVLDEHWRSRHRPQRRSWFRRPMLPPAGGRRNAPPAAPPVHQSVR